MNIILGNQFSYWISNSLIVVRRRAVRILHYARWRNLRSRIGLPTMESFRP